MLDHHGCFSFWWSVPMSDYNKLFREEELSMKITDSSLLLGSQRTYAEAFEEKTDLKFWIHPAGSPVGDRVSISQDARVCSECNSPKNDGDGMQDMDLEISLERLITEILSGRKVRILRTEDLKQSQTLDAPAESANPDESAQASEGWGLDYSHESVYTEQEAVSFNATGVIKTADGRELNFALRLDMSREYVERNSIRIRAGDALKDPLIINFDGTAARLGSRSFGFDIDADGTDESLPDLAAGKGYLAIDLNSDGKINDGHELFGPKSGNGFSELSRYDDDGNGWIDENDNAFSWLSVLSFDETGAQVIKGIASLGIGAISTASSSTRFDIKDQMNGDLLGRVRASGVYFAENGTAGTIQQVDLKV